MYCKNCGSALPNEAKFCKFCGNSQGERIPEKRVEEERTRATSPNVGYGLAGFSNRIYDPAFQKYIKSSNRWSAIFSIVLAIAAIIGFFIYGETSSEMENPQSLFIGFGIGGMFILIALFQILGRKRGKTWDGTVIDKTIKKKQHRQSTGSGDNDHYWVDYIEYTVYIKSDNGKKHKIRREDNDTIYNYYQIGDRVRYHGGLNSYEKYDKSRDKYIFCNACGSLNDMQSDCCFRCKCPLLK
ncbi:hypothetical protein SAMN05660462_00526 [Proteiniborus ethanoligenes]|uniref:Zinc-ribbon domain-containing protein n=1 Tax=Proteiniborus ethanoligenes TaxID=415015 RepID=A0A1H3LH77_9FIRM|nr:zinc ribbon domain-containing protein [Proteiniborus ethanoligenes]SDY63318.1 hypothetical protein SAMN05660462_00526 [Proteiniborus ethanoligenes]